jgi:putative ABC transport system permease protein
MLRATLKGLLTRKLRLVLAGLAVVFGVMAVSGSLIVTNMLGAAFTTLFQTVNADLDVQVTGPRNVAAEDGPSYSTPLPAALVDTVARVPGVAGASGEVLVDGAKVIGSDGKAVGSGGAPSFGTAWRGADGLVTLRSGRGPTAPDEVAVNAGLATQAGVTVGDTIQVLVRGHRRPYTLVGIFGYTGGRDSLVGESRIAFPEPVAQELMLGQRGLFSAINVKAAPGVSAGQLRDAVREAVGAGYMVRTGTEVADDQAAVSNGFIGVFRNFLLGFAVVTLFVGVFLILNTFSIVVAQRTRELALLRAIGASRRQVTQSVLVEATVVGLIASTLGLLAGLGIAGLLKTLLPELIGLRLPAAGLSIPPSAIIAGYTVGIAVTLVAALMPALRAARVPPAAAIREAATGDRPLTRLTVGGGLVTAAGATAVGFALFGRLGDATAPALLAGVLLVFVGAAMLTPVITRPAVSVLGWALSWSITGKLGRRNSARSPRRTAATAAALMIGVALVTGVSVLANSLKASIQQLVGQNLEAQLVISGEFRGANTPTYDPAVIDAVRQMPQVQQAVAVYVDAAQIGSETTQVMAGDVGAMVSVFNLTATAGQLRTLRHGETVVADDFAAARHLTVGDPLQVTTRNGGAQTFTVVGIYQKLTLLPGPVLSVDDARTAFRLPQPTFGYISVRDDADVPTVQRRVEELLSDNPEVGVLNQRSFIQQRAGQIDTFVVMLYILLGLALVIAVLGIVNTLALSVLERTREIGVLRAVGARRVQVSRMVMAESVVISLFGALLGTLVGSVLGVAVVRALHDAFIPVLSVPWTRMAFFLIPAVLAGLVAAVIPAVRAARTNILRAIAYE